LGKGTKRALIFGAVPFLTLVFALPFVNRVEPFVLGLPFVLFWILLWVALTPVSLFLAYKIERIYNPPDADFGSDPTCEPKSDATPDRPFGPKAHPGPAPSQTASPAAAAPPGAGAPARTSVPSPRDEAPR